MAGGDEAVVSGDPLEPRVELAVAELDDAVTGRAHEVMVVAAAAPAVAELAGMVGEGVHDPGLGEEPERPIDGRQAEALAPGPQALVELLRRHVVALAHELGEQRDPLPRRADAGFLEHAGRRIRALRPVRHGSMLALLITRIVLILLALAAGTALAGCGGGEAGAGGRTAIVAGFYPLAFAAEEVGGDSVEVVNLTPAGAEPHDVELSVRDVERVRSGDLVLYVGGGFQPALEDAVASSGVRAVDVLEGLDLRDGDPHVWLDPLRLAAIAELIGVELGREAAARPLAARLRELDHELRDGLADCRRHELVTAHDAFGYLAERYGLEAIAITGVAPETEPSPRDLERVAQLVRERGVTTVFVEPLLAPDVGETLARETGAETAVLDPLEGLSEEALERGDDYFSVMRTNLAALREGLECR